MVWVVVDGKVYSFSGIIIIIIKLYSVKIGTLRVH